MIATIAISYTCYKNIVCVQLTPANSVCENSHDSLLNSRGASQILEDSHAHNQISPKRM